MTLISANNTQPRRLTTNPSPRHVPVQATGGAGVRRATDRAATLKVGRPPHGRPGEVIALTGTDSTSAGLPTAAPAPAEPAPAEPAPAEPAPAEPAPAEPAPAEPAPAEPAPAEPAPAEPAPAEPAPAEPAPAEPAP